MFEGERRIETSLVKTCVFTKPGSDRGRLEAAEFVFVFRIQSYDLELLNA